MPVCGYRNAERPLIEDYNVQAQLDGFGAKET